MRRSGKKSCTRSGVSRQNSAIAIAGQEIQRERADLRIAKISPRTSATANPAIDASRVTSSPLSRIGRIEIANASSPWSMSQLRPNSMASAPCPLPARDRALEQPHQGGQHQRHAEIHEQDDRIDRRRILINEASAVSLRFCTARLPNDGIISGIACGRITRQSACRRVKLSAAAASC